jgi:flagellar protein FliL
MSTNEEPTPADAPPAAAPRSRKRLVWIGLAVVILMLGGGGGAWYFMYGQAASGEAEEEKVEEPEATGVVPFDPFVVNLADEGGSRFLRVSLSLVTAEESVEALDEPVTKTRVRSAILELLAQQTADTLITPEGKTALKTSIAGSAGKAASNVKVTDVFFTEFIVQF